MQLKAKFSHTKWDESTMLDLEGDRKITRASVGFDYTGEKVDGKSQVEYLMYYLMHDADDPHKARATYSGFLVFSGTLDGRKGSFVMRENGEYSAGEANSECTIIEGSGTEELTGITGTASFTATGEKDIMLFDVELP